MEFRPFWELLGEMGIALPDPSKVKKQSGFSRKPGRRMISIDSRQMPRSADELFALLEGMSEAFALEGGDDTAETDCWMVPDQTVMVSGYDLPGMVYVGEGLNAIRSYGIEPCLIRPTLKISRKSADYEKQPTSYQSSYSQMQPGDRSAYLRWLAEGRCAPKAHITYVWLFFCGLERRVLHDLIGVDFTKDQVKRQELDRIIAEVKRLKDLYGDPKLNWAFGNKAEMFLEICRLLRSPNAVELPIDPLTAKPFAIQVGLGQRVKQGQPIAADWALAWYVRLANHALPTAASRCLDEFKTLFQLRYRQEFGEGLKLKAGKVKLKTSYYPASSSFGRAIEVKVGDIPDVSRFTAKLTQIGELVQKCRLELESLSRFLGRNPEARNTPAAIALLPADLLPTHGGKVVAQLRKWLDQRFQPSDGHSPVFDHRPLVSGEELLQHWSGSNPEKLTKTEAIGLSQLLELFRYGMEPDPRFGGASPTLKSHVVLFRLPTAHPASLSAAHSEATLMLHLAIAVASGEEPPSAIEQQYMESHLASLALTAPEQARLQAHLYLLLHEQPQLRLLRVRIEQVKLERRGKLAEFALQVAAADGQLQPKEVQRLEKAYTLLGLDPQAVYSDIHHLSTAAMHPAIGSSKAGSSRADRLSQADREPVTVRAAAPTRGHKIPATSKSKKSQSNKAEITIDMSLVQSKLAESQEISHLLANIFVDEAVTPPMGTARSLTTAPPAAKPNGKSRKASQAKPIRAVAGLDVSHSELLFAVAKQVVWRRAELEPIAAQLDLMLDGAIEVINEVAFDRCDEALIEGDQAIEVNADVLRELLA